MFMGGFWFLFLVPFEHISSQRQKPLAASGT